MDIYDISEYEYTESNGAKVFEASEVRLKPGQWPQYIVYNNLCYIRSNFDLTSSGDIGGFWYLSMTKEKILIVND